MPCFGGSHYKNPVSPMSTVATDKIEVQETSGGSQPRRKRGGGVNFANAGKEKGSPLWPPFSAIFIRAGSASRIRNTEPTRLKPPAKARRSSRLSTGGGFVLA